MEETRILPTIQSKYVLQVFAPQAVTESIGKPMKVDRATQRYEQWLAQRMPLVSRDLRLKHTLMNRNAFSFLRATFYRWIQVWPEVCKELVKTPSVLAVGDVHVENFGTWRDLEGRLIWGINDFDEAYRLPYANDLVRLAVSAALAIEADHLGLNLKDACDEILTGYMEGVQSGGQPFVLSERHPWLRDIATNSLRDPVRFWRNMQTLPLVKGKIQQSGQQVLQQLMPDPRLSYRIRRRVAGVGSLGRPRYVALAEWQGGAIAREAKMLAPSACLWAQDGRGDATILYEEILNMPFAAAILLCGSWGTGWCAACRPIARKLSWRCSRKNGTKAVSFMRWAGKQPMCIWAVAESNNPCDGIWQSDRPSGFAQRPKRWGKR